jgi:hypothetical protein
MTPSICGPATPAASSFTYTLQDDQRTVHTPNGVVSDPWGNIIRWRFPWVSHCGWCARRGERNSRSFSFDQALVILIAELCRRYWRASWWEAWGQDCIWRSSSLAPGKSDKRLPSLYHVSTMFPSKMSRMSLYFSCLNTLFFRECSYLKVYLWSCLPH